MLGKLYLAGREVLHDEDRGVYWLTKSAEQDNQYAQYLLNHLEENRPPSAMLAVTRLLHHMSRVFQDNSVPKSRPGGIQIDRKRLKKLQEKRMALLARAEALMLSESPVIPLYWAKRSYLKRPEVRGWHPLLLDNHLFEDISLDDAREHGKEAAP